MRVLVVGGTGFLGSYVSKMLIEQHRDVDLLCRGKTSHTVSGTKVVYHLDRRCSDAVCKCFQGSHYDVVVDICAYSGDDVRILLDCIDTPRYVLCSTCEVYDFLDGQPINSTSHPIVDYGKARKYVCGKIDAEREVIASGKSFSIIRPSYIYGAGDSIHREDRIFFALLHGNPIKVKDLDISMNVIHVSDLAKIFVHQTITNENTIINASNPDRISYRRYLKACERIAGKEVVLISPMEDEGTSVAFPYLDKTIFIQPYPAEENHVEEMVRFEEGLQECFDRYKEQQCSNQH